MSRAVDPPDVVAMDKALSVLEELGALDQDGRLTALGRHMVRRRYHPPRVSPLTPSLGRTSSRPSSWKSGLNESDEIAVSNSPTPQMLILATVFQCLDPVLTIAACLSSKPVFLSPLDKRDEATAYDCSPHTHSLKAEVRIPEHAHALRQRKVTSSPTPGRTTNAREYATNSHPAPCAPSAQKYAPRTSESLSNIHPTKFPSPFSTRHDIRTTSPPRRSATSTSCGTTSSPRSPRRGSSKRVNPPRHQNSTRTPASPRYSRRSCSQHCTRASHASPSPATR